jgi:hypothetical protein
MVFTQPAEPVAPVAPPKPVGISFHNSVAVRVGFLAAGLISLLISIPTPPVISMLWQFILLLSGGFFSVFLYSRRTGESLSVRGGARMGWITGIFCFAIMMVLFTFSLVAVASSKGVAEFFREILSARGTPEMMDQFNTILSSPAGLASLLFGILAMFFIMLTLLPALGGALGAKVLEKE